MSKGGDDDVVFPEECYSVRPQYFRFVLSALTLRPKLDKVPHEYVYVSTADVITCQRAYHRCRSWLFPQIDAALHHGGAGTTGASLRGERYRVLGSVVYLPSRGQLVFQRLSAPGLGKSRQEARDIARGSNSFSETSSSGRPGYKS
jgi:hypothetical protein